MVSVCVAWLACADDGPAASTLDLSQLVYVNKGGCSFKVECGNTRRAPTPLFGEKVRCSAHGRTFARVRYLYICDTLGKVF